MTCDTRTAHWQDGRECESWPRALTRNFFEAIHRVTRKCQQKWHIPLTQKGFAPMSSIMAAAGSIPVASALAERRASLVIAHVCDSMEMGGAEKLTATLCRLQRDRGHTASVHCLYWLGVLGEELRTEGFEVILHHPSSFLHLVRGLYRSFRRSRPDVVHCHNATAAIMAALPARLAGVKTVIVTRHGLVKPPYQIRRELKFALASRCCDWIVGVCKGTRTNLQAAPFAARDKIVHIYNGADPADIRAVPQPKKGFTLLHVGRLAPLKDHATLLQAVALTRALHPDMQLWIVGDGPLEASLRKLTDHLGLNECVTFFGEQADVSPFLLAADLFVSSSVTEGLPVSLLEAMSAGLPALVTNVGGMGEIARLSGAVILVPASDPEAMAGALCGAFAGRQELSKMGQLASHCYEQYFRPERMLDDYMNLYNGYVAQNKALHSAWKIAPSP
jgi:glycosyltransferase involved in cell wall biosynthesis